MTSHPAPRQGTSPPTTPATAIATTRTVQTVRPAAARTARVSTGLVSLASRAAPPRLARRGRRDRGSVSVWVAASFVAILAVVGLVADGGAKIRAGERADLVAGEAARAASYAAGGDDRARTAAAVTAARALLSQSGVAGTVTVAGPGQITVTAQATAAGPISGHTYTVTRTATAQLLIGVRTGGTP